MVIKGSQVVSAHRPLFTTVKCPMKPTDNVIDFALHRKRKQAQQLARVMWEMYARNAGYAALQMMQPLSQTETRHA
ncbi:hypothetical protein C8K61_109183 [Pseudomonas sp. GV071]|nr:hypothetical protein C8K61_109183 [Pseudomonas sp. GV071]